MELQMAMFTPTSEWTPPTELPDLSEAKQIAVDVETRDPKIKTMGPGWARQDGEIVGYAVATEWWSGYVPVKHWGGGNLDDRIVRKWMQKVLATPADKIMHNAQYDLGWLRAEGFTVNGRIIDTMVVASLFDENRFSYSLNALCYDLLGKTKSEKALVEAAKSFGVDPKGEMWKLPAMHVGPYATTDAELALELWQYFAARIPVENLKTIFDLEMKLLPTLVDMTLRGVRVDLDRVERIKQHILTKEKDINKQIRDMVGEDVEIWAGNSLARAFEKQSIAFPKTERGAPSFTKAFLAEHEHPLPQLIVQAREYNKINGTFIDSILRYVAPDGRIHGHINQIRSDDGGTVSGRISMNNPNMQQLPARHPELGPMIRSVFVPEQGEKWASIDYSQQEPRILVHYAEVFRRAKNISMPGVSEFVDGYRDNPNMDFHSMVAEMADIPRKQAKVINLAMMYGMGRAKLAAQLDISDEEAKELTDKYHDRVPFVKKLTKGVQMRLNDPAARGQIFSLRGRRCRFNLYEPEGFGMHKAMPLDEARAHYGPTTKLQRAMTYKALNRLIQASAADMTKQAMVDLADAGFLPLLQIHDELAFSVKAKEDAEKIAEIMEKSIELEIPMKTDIEMGDSWGDSM